MSAAQVSRTVQEYLAELEQANPVADTEMVSTTDPDAVWATKGGPAMMAYFDNYLMNPRQTHRLRVVRPRQNP